MCHRQSPRPDRSAQTAAPRPTPLQRAGCPVPFLHLLPSVASGPLRAGKGLEGSPKGDSAALFMSLAEGIRGRLSQAVLCFLLSMKTDKYGDVRGLLPCQESGLPPHPVYKPPAESP